MTAVAPGVGRRACACATPRPTRWASSTTRTTSSGSRSAAPSCCATLGWSYREMEADGMSLPVIEAHCEYRQPARYDDELEIRTSGTAAVAGAPRVRLRGRAASDDAVAATGRTVHAALDPSGPAVPAAGTRPGGRSHEGARHRRRRVHRLAPRASACSIAARDVDGHRLLHRLLPARRSRKRNLAALRGAAALPLRRGRASRRPTSAALLDGVTHVFHLAAQAGVRKSWGRDFRIYTANNIEATQSPARGLRRAARSSASSTRRARRCTATTRRMPMREDALPQPRLAVRRDEAGGRAALLPLPRRTTACRPCRCATSRSTARGSAPTWASTGSSARRCEGEPITLYGDGEQTRDFTFVADAVAATIAAGDARRARARLQYRRRLARVDQRGARHDRPRHRPPARHPRGSRRRRATCATPTPTRRGRAPTSGFAPSVSLDEGLAAEAPTGSRLLPCGTCMTAALDCDSRPARAPCRRRCSPRWPLPRCAAKDKDVPPPGTAKPDKFLFEQGHARRSTRRSGSTAREYFRQIVDTYPQSPYRPDAKLGVGDTYLGEGTRRVARARRSTSSASS